MSRYDCQVPGCEFGSHSPLGTQAHSRKHRRQYRELTGERPDDYDTVKQFLAGRVGPDGDLLSRAVREIEPPGDQATLLEALE